MTPGLAVSKYKVQGATCQIAVVNMHHNFKIEDKILHKRFCSTYIQLLHLQILDKVNLLQLMILKDIRSKPDAKLQEKSLMIDDILN